MSAEAIELVNVYGSFFIQFSHFTYLRVGGFKGEPFRLPRYVSDSCILIEVSRQLAYMAKDYGKDSDTRRIFPIDLGHYSYKSVSNALNLELEFKKFHLKSFVKRDNFDSRCFIPQYVKKGVSDQHVSQLEDYWEGCQDEFEVRRRSW